MGAFSPSVLNVTSSPSQMIGPVGGNCLFYNALALDTIYLGYDTNLVVANAVPVLPFSTVTMDTSRAVYGFCPTNNNATIVVAPGASGIRTVAPTTPAIETLSPLMIIFNQPIAPGATVQLFRVNVARFTSAVATCFAMAQGGTGLGAAPFYRLRFQWSFSNDGFDPIITDDWVGATSPLSFTQNFRNQWQSNCSADTLTVFITNYDTQPLNFTIGIFGSYRSKTLEMRGRYPDGIGAESQGLVTDNIIASVQQAAIAANTVGPAVTLPLYAGSVSLSGQLAGEAAAGTVLVRIQPQPASVIAGQIIVLSQQKAGLITPASLTLPRRVCTLTVDNTAGAAPVTPNLLITGGSDNQ